MDDRTVLRVDLPGVVLEQIELRIEADRLTLRGERRSDAGQSGSETHLRERPSGRFHRSFELPPSIDQGGIRAELRHGVLEVVLPKRPASSIKPIKVEAR
jgi:HSP20 family protein